MTLDFVLGALVIVAAVLIAAAPWEDRPGGAHRRAEQAGAEADLRSRGANLHGH